MRTHKMSKKELTYWSQVFSGIGHVFVGIAAGSTLVGEFDSHRTNAVVLSLIFALIFWLFGWRIVK